MKHYRSGIAGWGRSDCRPASTRLIITLALLLALGGCAGSGGTGIPAGDPLPAAGSDDGAAESQQGEPETGDDTEYVDTLSLPTVAAPVVIGTAPQTTAPVGRNTQEAVSPPQGAQVNSNLGFFPSLTISATRRDNPAREHGEDEQEDTSWSIVPVLKYRGAIRNRHVYELGVSAATETFDELEELDSDTLNYNAALRLDMTEKLKVDLYGNHAKSSDTRGATGARLLQPGEANDEYEETAFGGRVTLGRRTNPLQLVLGAQQGDLDFTNNNQDARDRTDQRIHGGVYVNISPRTSFFLNAGQTTIDYAEDGSAGFDSTNTDINLGVGWEPSYTTSLLLQAGTIEKSYDTHSFDDQDTNSYLGKLSWLPTEFTSLNMYTSRTFEETTDRSSPVTVSDLVGLSMDHAFTDSIRGQVYFNLIDDDLVNVRQDETTDYGVGLFYDFNRYLSLGASWSRTDRSSTDPAADYDSDAFSITASIKPARSRDFGEPEIQTSDGLRSAQ